MSESNTDPTEPNRPSSVPNEILAGILANAVDAIITIDRQGIIQAANPATERMFGYSVEDLLGQNVKLLMPQPYRTEHDQYLDNYLRSGTAKIIGIGREVLGQKQDGSTFPIHLAVSELQLADQRLFTGIIRDISDVKSVEAKLVQSERLAAIGQMMAGLAHESRNAFQKSHACLTNLAYDVREMPESLALVGKVQQALDHLNSLLDEVRDYSAPIILEWTATDLETLVRELWVQVMQANDHQIRFEIHKSEDFPDTIRLDRVRLGQVIWNLVSNACAAADSQSGQVDVRLGLDTERQAFLEVDDDGPGVPMELRARIFEPFFTTKTKGTGLGLAICQRIVEAHDGSLNLVESQLGGACFRILLPT